MLEEEEKAVEERRRLCEEKQKARLEQKVTELQKQRKGRGGRGSNDRLY